MQGIANNRYIIAKSYISYIWQKKSESGKLFSVTWFLRVGATGFEPAT